MRPIPLIIISLIISLCNVNANAQIKALTENGRQVVLFENGTWKYQSDSVAETAITDSIPLNPVKIFKTPGATFLVKSNRNSTAVFVDPNKWTVAPHHDNEVNPEYRFTDKTDEGMAFLVAEKTQIQLSNMPDIALINARKASYNAEIIKKEYRIVNNVKVLYLEIKGTIKGIDFRYMGYYYSDESGTTQLVCYTSEGMYNKVRNKFEAFLNGLTIEH